MAIITLTTDFGYKDHFVGTIKGTILRELPEVKIVDISHGIQPFHIPECAYILKNSYQAFPQGTIHIVGVDSERTAENQHLAILVDGHYFIVANNGVISLIISAIKPEKVIEINIHNPAQGSFPVLDVFVQAACHLARGGKLDVIGKPFEAIRQLVEFKPRIVEDGKTIIGSVLYIDNFGNVISNIEKHLFDAYRNGRNFEIRARNKRITEIQNRYSDIINFDLEKNQRKGPGDLLALFNNAGFLELAIYKSDTRTVGSAASLLGLEYRDTIMINFL